MEATIFAPVTGNCPFVGQLCRVPVHRSRFPEPHPMNEEMNPMPLPPAISKVNSSWALQMRATTMEEPARLIQTLTGAILGAGGWVLSRGANDAGLINMFFEFERQSCVDMYTVLIAVGLELSQLAHLRFTELCQCTR